MKRFVLAFVACFFCVIISTPSQAELTRISNDIFYDGTQYWYDNPGYFDGYSRAAQSTMIGDLSVAAGGFLYNDWRWATQDEVVNTLLPYPVPLDWSNPDWRTYFDGTWVPWNPPGSQFFNLTARSTDSPGKWGSDVLFTINASDGTTYSAAFDDFADGAGAWVVTDSRTPVPLPPSFLLLAPGLLGLIAVRRRRRT